MAAAIDLTLPTNARQTAARTSDPGRYAVPVGPFAGDAVPVVELDGQVRRTAWRVDTAGLTPLQVLAPLRAQLEGDGFEVVLDCAAPACGGFDFRFGIETLSAPDMYVNLRRFHHLTAMQYNDGVPAQAVTVLVSTASRAAYVQIIQAGKKLDQVSVSKKAVVAPPQSTGTLAAALLDSGHVVLSDLTFKTGSADLGDAAFASLTELAEFMSANPTIRIALVGHTDSVGSLQGNIALSRKRAQSVRARLIRDHGLDPERLEGEGMGYLAPVASNLEEAGREANRRVEAILLSQ